MNMLNICAQILDSDVCIFTGKAVSVVHIPKCREIVAGKAVEHIAQFCGICKNTVGFDKQSYACLFCQCNGFCKALHHLV